MLTEKNRSAQVNRISVSICPPQITHVTKSGPPKPGLVGRIESYFVNLPF